MKSDRASRIETLDNGVVVVSRYVPEVSTIESITRIDAGSRDEIGPTWRFPNGTSHALEHGLCCATESAAVPLRQAISSITGAPAGNDVFEPAARRPAMVFKLSVSADAFKPALGKQLAVISRPVGGLIGWETEKDRIRDEEVMGEHTAGNLQQRVAPYVAYGKNPALYPVIGDAKGIDDIRLAHLQDFKAATFRSGRMQIFVEGPIQHEEIVQLVKENLRLPAGKRRSDKTAPAYTGGDERTEQAMRSTNVVVAFDAPLFNDQKSGAAFQAVYHLLATPGPHSIPDALSDIGRYHAEIVAPAMIHRSLLTISMQTFAHKVDPSLHVIYDKIAGLAAHVDERMFAKWHERQVKEANEAGEIVTFSAGALMSDYSAFKNIMPADFHAQNRAAVTIADICKAAGALLTKRATFVAEGNLSGLPDADTVKAIFHDRPASKRPAWDIDSPRRNTGLSH